MVVLVFRADAETRATVDDLARREAACCPFVDYRVETVGEEIVWTITNPVTGEDRASVEVMLDAFHELAGPGGHAVPVRTAERLEHHQVPFYVAALAVGVAVGLIAPGTAGTFEALIYPVLGALLYATFLQVPFTALREAFGDRRFLLAALGLNFLLVPPIAFGLSRFAPDGVAVELGVLMVLLTPCIDYVIVFTRLAGGSDRRLLAAAPLLMLAQMALLPRTCGCSWVPSSPTSSSRDRSSKRSRC